MTKVIAAGGRRNGAWPTDAVVVHTGSGEGAITPKGDQNGHRAAALDGPSGGCPSHSWKGCRAGRRGPRVALVHLLHIAHQDDWHRALDAGTYDVSTRGRRLDEVGYIHASFPEQVQQVARQVYADDPDPLCVLVVDEALVTGAGVRVEIEDGGDGEMYPHIYGAIERSWVVDVRPAAFDDAGRLRF